MFAKTKESGKSFSLFRWQKEKGKIVQRTKLSVCKYEISLLAIILSCALSDLFLFLFTNHSLSKGSSLGVI